ncbi:MAG: YciI family protein [Jatrophihabitantaceae bacterium]
MKYMLVYYDDPASGGLDSDERQEAYREACEDWQAEMASQGVLLQTMGLLPPDEATTVRVRDGKSLIADGPFAETREQMGGVSLLECVDLDQAQKMAARHPWSAIGLIEIRPIREQ